jgi:hypothetical protein
MLQIGQDAFEGTLIEPQGVNAGAAIDAGSSGVPHTVVAPVAPPTSLRLSELLPDEMVGLPEQRYGYPGQQRSIETS